MSDETMKDGERAALTDQQIYDKFYFLEGLVSERTYRQIADTAIEITRAAYPQSGEKGEEPVAWFTDDHLTDKSATTWDRNVADRWLAKGWPVNALYARAAAPQAALDEIVYAVQAYGDARADGGNSADAIGKVCRLLRALTQAPTERMSEAEEPQWIVNDLGELGVKVGSRFFFLYKGDNLEYGADDDGDVALHDDGTPMNYRIVGKREFGEVCWPVMWITSGKFEDRYTEKLAYRPGLSFGKPEDGDWKPLPSARKAEIKRMSDGLLKLIEEAANYILDAVTYKQEDLNLPGHPATQWDYNAEQLAYALRATARKAEIERGEQ